MRNGSRWLAAASAFATAANATSAASGMPSQVNAVTPAELSAAEKDRPPTRPEDFTYLRAKCSAASPANVAVVEYVDPPDMPNRELYNLLLEEKRRIDERQREWLTSYASIQKEIDAAEQNLKDVENKKQIEKLLKLRSAPPTPEPAAPLSKIADLEKKCVEAQAKAENLRQWIAIYLDHFSQARDSDVRLASRLNDTVALKPNVESCAIDTPQQRRHIDLDKCSKIKVGEPLGPVGAFGSRVLSARGVTTEFSASDAKGEATLKIAGTIGPAYSSDVWRTDRNENHFRRPELTGFELGLRSATGLLFNQSEDRAKASEDVGELDLIDTSLVGFVTLSHGWFPREYGLDFDRRATEKYAELRKLCVADLGRTTADPAIQACEGQQFHNWIFQRKANGDWANPGAIQIYNNMFYGAAQDKPSLGGGLRGEVGFPVFRYYDLPRTLANNPLTGEDVLVIDVANLPQDFIDGNPTRQADLIEWNATLFGFMHFPTPRGGHTFIGSFTYKNDWDIPSANEKLLICPALNGQYTGEFCRKDVNTAPAEEQQEYVLGGEYRYQGRLPWFGQPLWGVAPKLTWELDRGRVGYSIPLLIDVDEKGRLVGGVKFEGGMGGVDADGDDRQSEHIVSILFGYSFDLSGFTR